jgi:hypothetical protein
MSTTKPNIFTAQFIISGTTATIANVGSNNGTKTIYDLEKDAFDALNDFNTKYANYLRCTPGLGLRIGETVSEDRPAISAIMDDENNDAGTVYYDNKEGCPNVIPDYSSVNTAKTTLKTKVALLESAINQIKNYNGTEYSKLDNTEYTTNLDAIKQTHTDIIAKRNEYDAKLKELNNKEGLDKTDSPWDAAIQREQEMMFVGTTGAILASALIYYIFSKL